VDAKTTVSLSRANLPVRSALRTILAGLDLAWVIRGEAILIPTKAEAENILATRVYDVEDLLVFPGGEMGELIEMLTSTLEPVSWDDTGGPGTIRACRGPGTHAIIVTQTQELHEQIAELLAALRRVRGRRPAQRAMAESSRSASQPKRNPSRPRARSYVTAPEWALPLAHE
jgi:hypothetical protein